jgi:hypothetical protein
LVWWLEQQQWHWAIRVKSDLSVTLADGHTYPVESLVPPPEHAHLFEQVRVLGGVVAHLATANAPDAKDHWAVLSNQRPSLQTFALIAVFASVKYTLHLVQQAWTSFRCNLLYFKT